MKYTITFTGPRNADYQFVANYVQAFTASRVVTIESKDTHEELAEEMNQVIEKALRLFEIHSDNVRKRNKAVKPLMLELKKLKKLSDKL